MQSIENKLRQAWAQQQRFVHLRGLSRFVIWLVVMIVVDFLIDWGIVFRTRMTANLGLLLLLINVVVLAWVLWYEWLRHLKPYNPLLVALAVEKQHPELSSLLVSYTQLDDIKKNQPNVSAELVQAMQDNAVTLTKPLDFREIVNFGQLTRLLTVAGGVLLLFAAISYSMPDHMRVLMERLTGGTREYPTQTTIVDVDTGATVRVGDSVTLTATVEGVIPETGTIYTKPASGGSWTTLPLRPENDSLEDEQVAFGRTLEELTQDVSYYVRIGDDQSEVHQVRVVPSPRVESSAVALIYPSYMGRDEGSSQQLNLEVPKGTELQWSLAVDSPVHAVEVELHKISREGDEETKTIHATILNDGKTVAFSETAEEAIQYTFHWTLREDGQELSYDDVQYNVRVVADAVPDLELLEPTSSGLATVNKRLNIKSHGSDDYGLAQGWLVYSVTGESQERRLPIRNFQGGAGEQFSFATALDGLIDGLQEKFEQSAETGGLQISLAVEVADLMGTTTFKVDESSGALSAHAHGLNNDQPVMLTTTGELPEPLKAGVVYWVTQADENGFQLAAAEGGDAIALATSGEGEHRYGSLASWQERTRRSATRHLTIVDDERYMQWYRTELASQHDEIKRAQGIEQVSSTKIKEIKVQEGDAE